MPPLDPRSAPFLGALLPALAAAVASILAFPPFDESLWWLTFLAPLPLIAVAAATTAPFRSALATLLASLPAAAWHHLWIIDVSPLGFPVLIAYLALYPALFVALTAHLLARFPAAPAAIVAPIVWVALELLRGQIAFHGYPWYLVAHPTIHWLGLASLASITGTYALGALVVAPAAIAIDAARNRLTPSPPPERRIAGAIVAVATLALLAWAASPLSPFARRAAALDARTDPPRVRVAVVQTGLPQDNKIGWSFEARADDFASFLLATIRATGVSPQPDLIVWPETMFPGYSLSPDAVEEERRANIVARLPDANLPVTAFYDNLIELQAELDIPMIVGAIGAENLVISADDDNRIRYTPAREFNSAFLIERGAVSTSRYDKIHLTPFGEVMPYISAIPALEKNLLDLGAHGMSFSLAAGTNPTRLDVPIRSATDDDSATLRVAAPICFEISNPSVARRLVFDAHSRAANAIVQLSNDGWFADHPGSRMTHLHIARWRAIELATPVVRAVNTGVSAAIDAAGRITRIHAVPLDTASPSQGPQAPLATLIADIRPADRFDATPYVTIRDYPAWAALLATAIALIASYFRTPRPGRRTNDPPDHADAPMNQVEQP